MCLVLGNQAFAQSAPDFNTFSVSGQIRPRAEFRSGAFRPLNGDEDPAMLISSRNRLNLNYAHRDFLKLKFSLQNISIWGQANPVQTPGYSGNDLSVFEAWADLKIANHLHSKVGRQVISLDDERFFGEVDWMQAARAHDALSLEFEKNNYQLKGHFAFNQNYKANYGNSINNPAGNLYSTTDVQAYKFMTNVWAKIPVYEKGSLSFLVNNLGLQNADTGSARIKNKMNHLQTFGLNFSYNADIMKALVSGYYQTGKTLAGQKTDAFLLAANAAVSFSGKWEAGIGTDYLSGNDFGKVNDKNHAFQPFFGTNHKFYGSMDYYYAGNTHGNVGLMDSYLKLGWQFSPKGKMALAGHWFHAAASVFRKSVKRDSDLGHELDWSFVYKIRPFIDLQGGYSGYFVTPALRLVKNTPTAASYQQWMWLTLNVNPDLFRAKY